MVIASHISKVGDVCCTDPADAVHPRTVAAHRPHKWLSAGVCTLHAIITILAKHARWDKRCDSEEVIASAQWPCHVAIDTVTYTNRSAKPKVPMFECLCRYNKMETALD